ncbi:MAG: putative Gag-Pro-Pol polyprotein [Streblomastix strix]|uniref:Putative Gag-Pro-Pol polyprotein n=1 Tax=Streblomastix strix TaxID=222440 RepID=A0A5J4WP64_9EUKA|nr:MAG: putative Gag-Pro-Pol polyprotein [Streblomastix strix]
MEWCQYYNSEIGRQVPADLVFNSMKQLGVGQGEKEPVTPTSQIRGQLLIQQTPATASVIAGRSSQSSLPSRVTLISQPMSLSISQRNQDNQRPQVLVSSSIRPAQLDMYNSMPNLLPFISNTGNKIDIDEFEDVMSVVVSNAQCMVVFDWDPLWLEHLRAEENFVMAIREIERGKDTNEFDSLGINPSLKSTKGVLIRSPVAVTFQDQVAEMQVLQTKEIAQIPLNTCLQAQASVRDSLSLSFNLRNGQDLSWVDFPPHGRGITAAYFNSIQEFQAMDNIILKELRNNMIIKVHPWNAKFYSPIFLFTKSTGGFRKIINCHELNYSLNAPHFKMEDARTWCDLIFPGAFMVTVDLQHAYFHVQVSEEASKWIGFEWRIQTYMQKTLCFGLYTAPYSFTILMRRVLASLRPYFTIMAYLDEVGIIDHSFIEADDTVLYTLKQFFLLGLTVEFDKSKLQPSHKAEYQGFLWDSEAMTMEPIPKRIIMSRKLKQLDRIRISKSEQHNGIRMAEVANDQKRTGATSLNPILLSILQKVEDNYLKIKAIYIRGIYNITANKLSGVVDGADFIPQIDEFATKWNRQSKNYVSWVQDEDTKSTNSLFRTWIILEKTSAILITPDWKTLSVLEELRRLNKECVKLPEINQYCLEGPGMSAANASLPPGRLLAWRI